MVFASMVFLLGPHINSVNRGMPVVEEFTLTKHSSMSRVHCQAVHCTVVLHLHFTVFSSVVSPFSSSSEAEAEEAESDEEPEVTEEKSDSER